MSEITLLSIGTNLIVPIQSEVDDYAAANLQTNILERIEKTGASGVIIDVSGVSIIDSFMARLLVETARMAKLMGAETVITGLKKEVVLTLIQLGMKIKDLHTALNIEEALAMLQKNRQ